MSLRARLKSTVQKALNKFSGEYSAAESEIRAPAPGDPATPTPAGEVKVTRARLKRPKDAAEERG